MAELNDTVTAYLSTWNATDAVDRRALLERHWSAGVIARNFTSRG